MARGSRRIRVWVETGFAGCNHEDYYPLPDNWDQMSEQEQQEHLDELAYEFRGNCIEYGAYVEAGDWEA